LAFSIDEPTALLTGASRHRPCGGRHLEWGFGELLLTGTPNRLAVVSAQARHVGAGRTNPEGERTPPVIEGGDADRDGQPRAFDVAEAGLAAESVELTRL